MKKILITGASGLVGRNLVPLLEGEAELRLAGRDTLDLGTGAGFDALPDRIDAIVYLAQSDHFRAFPERADDMFAVNVVGPMRLLDYARRAGARQFIYASSGGVYGSSPLPIGEEVGVEAHGDLGFYLTTKLATEMLARNYSGLLDVVLLRLFFAYGEGQKRQMLVPRLIDNVRTGRPVMLQGDTGIRINPVHAGDAARAVKAALGLEGSHTINIAGPEVLSIREMCDAIGRQVGREPVFDVTAAGSDLVADVGRMGELLAAPTLRFGDCLPTLVGSR